MTGTGTQNDPYIIENYSDLLNITEGSTKYYKLGVDIDVSQYRSPNDAPINLKAAEFDGDGHTISNFFRRENSSDNVNSMFSQNISTPTVVKNLNITGAYLAGGKTSLVYPLYNNSTIRNCRISAKIVDTGSAFSFMQFKSFQDCEILLEGQCNILKPLSSTNIEGCLIKYDMICNQLNATTTFGTSNLLCGIRGRIKNLGTSGEIRLTSTSTNSYYAIDINTATAVYISNVSGVNFYDSEVMAGVADVMPVKTGLYALTTEQCKNAEYLQEIGFPCQSGVNI